MHPFRFSALILFALAAGAGCQSVVNWAHVRSAPIEWKRAKRIDLPLTADSGGRPIVPVTVAGQRVSMIIDSGSSAALLARAIVDEGGLPTQQRIGTVNGQRVRVSRGVPIELGDHSMTIDPVVWEHHDPSWSAPVLLGANLFRQAVVDVDFRARRLSIIQAGAFVPPDAQAIPLGLFRGRPTVRLAIGVAGHPICAVVDTGFNGGLALTDHLVETLSLQRDPRGGTTVLSGALGERWERPNLAPIRAARVAHLDLGRVGVGHARGSEECSNLLGMEVLSRYRVIFDLSGRRLWMLPRS